MMDIKYEYLEMIPELKNMLIKLSSPFLSRKELGAYLKVSESFIKQRLYSGELQEGKHFFKISSSTMLFDRLEIDEWIRAKGNCDGKPIRQKQQTLSKYISQRSKNY